MEQIFNPKRFINYAVYQTVNNRRSIFLIAGGATVALFLFLYVLVISDGVNHKNQWMGAFWGTSIILALLLIGHAFPGLRKKTTSINFVTTPASIFEKYTFEIVVKIILFFLLFPFVFMLLGELAVAFAKFTLPHKHHPSFTYKGLTEFMDQDFFPIIRWLYIFGVTIAFAGASAFKKLPLLKTLIVLGVLIGIISGYFYFIMEHLNMDRAIGNFLENSRISNDDDAMKVGIWILAFSSVVAITYAFFNIKEREV